MEYFPFELRIRPHHEYKDLNFVYVLKLKLFLCLGPLHHSAFDMEKKSPLVHPPNPNPPYHKEKCNCMQNIKVFSLVSFICALLYLWFT